MTWRYKLNLKQFTKEYDEKEDSFKSSEEERTLVMEIAKKVAEHIRGLSEIVKFDMRLPANERKDLFHQLSDIADDFALVQDKDDFNTTLEELYDLGDLNDIWVNNISIHVAEGHENKAQTA